MPSKPRGGTLSDSFAKAQKRQSTRKRRKNANIQSALNRREAARGIRLFISLERNGTMSEKAYIFRSSEVRVRLNLRKEVK